MPGIILPFVDRMADRAEKAAVIVTTNLPFTTLKTVAQVDKAGWDFRKKDDAIQQCGGLHVKGKGPKKAFAVMPVAYLNGQLVVSNAGGGPFGP